MNTPSDVLNLLAPTVRSPETRSTAGAANAPVATTVKVPAPVVPTFVPAARLMKPLMFTVVNEPSVRDSNVRFVFAASTSTTSL